MRQKHQAPAQTTETAGTVETAKAPEKQDAAEIINEISRKTQNLLKVKYYTCNNRYKSNAQGACCCSSKYLPTRAHTSPNVFEKPIPCNKNGDRL